MTSCRFPKDMKNGGNLASLRECRRKCRRNICNTCKEMTVTPRTIQRDLEALQRLGIISHKGSDKGGYWEVNAKLH